MVPTVAAALALIEEGLDTLAAADTGVDEVQALVHARNRLDAALARCARRVDRSLDGRMSTASWLAWKCRMRKSEAARLVSNGAALASMPATGEAFDAGLISSAHVSELARAQRFAASAFAKAEDELVRDALSERFDVFARRVRYFEQLAEPDGVEARALDAFERRSAHCSTTFEGTRRVDATLDPIGGAIFQRELERLEQQLFEQDWAAARRDLGERATASDLPRTPAQRRTDAMVQMAINSAAKPANATEARVLLSVLVGYETLFGRICELADGTVVTPGQVVPWLDRADVERAVFGPEGRVIDLGRRARLFRGGARRAAQLSDVECTADGCTVRYERCEVDHIEPWAAGGPTDQRNARLRCPAHHEGRRRPRPPPDP